MDINKSLPVKQKKPMKLRTVRALLYKKGISLKDLAKMSGRSHSTVRVVLSGHGTSIPIMKVVAELLKIPEDRLRKAA